MFAIRFAAPALAAAMLLAVADRATAQARYPYDSRVDRSYDVAYNNGYREGFDEGQKDARNGDRYRYVDEGDFRSADKGYRREYGDRDRYRRVFRDGFIQGYSEGYDGRVARSGRYGSVPDSRARVDPRWGSSLAREHGFSDGYERGLEDARDRDRYDPVRHGHYRSADHGYNSSYGSRERYKNEFREAFRSGYDAGYRDGQRYGRNAPRNRVNRPWWLPF